MQSFRLMTVIAAAAGFVACQENTVDTQGEILPKLATDAQNTYVADPTLPENITFNVSSNTPWRITVDCGEGFAERPWCSVSPSLSAVSSLVEEVTIKMKDNPTYESRTAAITIEADGIAEPTVITVRQTGQGNRSCNPGRKFQKMAVPHPLPWFPTATGQPSRTRNG